MADHDQDLIDKGAEHWCDHSVLLQVWVPTVCGHRLEDVETVAEEAQDDDHHHDEWSNIVEYLSEQDWVDGCLLEQSEPIEELEPHAALNQERHPEDEVGICFNNAVQVECADHILSGSADHKEKVHIVPVALKVELETVADATAAFFVTLSKVHTSNLDQLVVAKIGPSKE